MLRNAIMLVAVGWIAGCGWRLPSLDSRSLTPGSDRAFPTEVRFWGLIAYKKAGDGVEALLLDARTPQDGSHYPAHEPYVVVPEGAIVESVDTSSPCFLTLSDLNFHMSPLDTLVYKGYNIPVGPQRPIQLILQDVARPRRQIDNLAKSSMIDSEHPPYKLAANFEAQLVARVEINSGVSIVALQSSDLYDFCSMDNFVCTADCPSESKLIAEEVVVGSKGHEVTFGRGGGEKCRIYMGDDNDKSLDVYVLNADPGAFQMPGGGYTPHPDSYTEYFSIIENPTHDQKFYVPCGLPLRGGRRCPQIEVTLEN